ncbi:protein sneaky-like isoform X2 [Choristoneura fumiferana]|uniref:protein sneaky-like isoform X2 n=1 Tax=Choristoneura fumiferana TaxID=7141 RepID=UPI003D15D083
MGLLNYLKKCCSSMLEALLFRRRYRWLRGCFAFAGGCGLGKIYYNYMLKNIPVPPDMGGAICMTLCVILGPITNMGLNAKEVVRVFACSTELAYNLSKCSSSMVARPLRHAVAGLKEEIEGAAETLRYFQDVTAPIMSEIEYESELASSRELTDKIDAELKARRSGTIGRKYAVSTRDRIKDVYQKKYLMKTEYRCNNLLSRSVLRCKAQMAFLLEICYRSVPIVIAPKFCSALEAPTACNVLRAVGNEVCDTTKQADSGLGEGYVALKQAKGEMMKGWREVNITDQESHVMYDAQDAKETGERVKQAFEEKFSIMQSAIVVVNICTALLFLRIVLAAQNYHDTYLTSIEFDNVYVTDNFKRIDRRRLVRNESVLLPLKKMERSRYKDLHSLAYTSADRHRLVAQALKVLLEMVTATTFVMLDRLFYEALDVVRQHAEQGKPGDTKDLSIEVEGTGIIANTLRALLFHLESQPKRARRATNVCLPQPRLMPAAFFFRIYGGYVWILLLLSVNPYTLRLRRLICSYFYPRREKQRVLHLYNDVLKKRIKLDETLRRKAVQAVRAHYLSGESMLSARMRFPTVLGWLRVLPAARMACLICSEIEPRKDDRCEWHTCFTSKCPFMYCGECWREVGERCLACDPSLAELSDVDSLSEDELPKY